MNRLLITAVTAVALGAAAAGYYLTRPRVAILGFSDQTILTAEKAATRANLPFDRFMEDSVDAPGASLPSLNRYKTILVNARRSRPYEPHVEQRLRAASNAGARILVLPPTSRSVMDFANVDLRAKDNPIAAYFQNGGVENWTRLFHYIAHHHLGRNATVLPPVELPDDGFYHPAHSDVFPSVHDYLKWAKANRHWNDNAPTVLIDFANGWKVGATAPIDETIRIFEASGLNVAAFFGWPNNGAFLHSLKPDVILNRSHGRFYQGDRGVELLATTAQSPLIRSLSLQFDRKTIADYAQTKDGIRGPALSIGTIVSEFDGTIAPILTEGLQKDSAGRKLSVAIPERIHRLAARIHKIARLRRLPNRDKKIAIVYFAGIGKADFTAAGLNVPNSLSRFLSSLQSAGYHAPNAPSSPETLLAQMLAKGHNIAEEHPGELQALLASQSVTLLPVEQYNTWFQKLPKSLQTAVLDAYGPPPGAFMSVRKDGKSFFLIPSLHYGNVILLPQPARGAKVDAKLQHSDTVPPPHQYLAVYFYLQHAFQADAVVHYGTHGTYEFLPGRPVGQLDDDWSDQVVGALPSIYVYTMDNVGEALLAKRRGVAEMVSHQTPPIAPAQLSASDNDLANLYRLTQSFSHTEEGTLKQRMREQIRELATKRNLDRDNRWDWRKSPPSDDEILKLDQYLDDLEEAKIPVGLHTHSVANPPAELALTITEILGRPYIEQATGKQNLQGLAYRDAKLHAAKLVAAALNRPAAPPAPPKEPVHHASATTPSPSSANAPARPRRSSPAGGLTTRETSAALQPRQSASPEEYATRIAKLKAGFAATANEIPATLAALDGKYVRPGGGGDPVRAPQALPTGRNLYGVNPAEIPTRTAWDIGVQLTNDLIAAERKRLGRYPKKIGFNLWPTEVIRQYGTDLAQILFLLGVQPVWDERGIIVDLTLIPAVQLQRPRIDVVIQAAGQFRDSFPDRMELIDNAVRLAAAATDAENFIAANALELEATLKQQGLSPKDAKTFSLARVFSNATGGYGTGLTGGIAKSGAYTDSKSLSAEYLERAGAVYSSAAWGRKIPKLYESALKNVDAVSISNSSNTTSALTLDHYFEYLGGMTMAIRDAHNQKASAYISDTRDADKTRTLPLEDALAQDFRTQFWNKKWIAAMQDQSFSGASEITKLVTNLYGWQVTRPESVQAYMWQQTFETYIQDTHQLGLKSWFDSKNAFAFQNLTATMLEAIRKGYWKADELTTRTLANEYASSVARHGPSGSERTAGNAELAAFVQRQLDAPGNITGIQLSANFTKALNQAASATPNSTFVTGQKLVQQITSPITQASARNSLAAIAIMAAAFILFFAARRRS